MQRVTILTKVADFKQGKFIDEILTEVVASTKTQNILLDNIKKSGKIVASVEVKDLFINKKEVETALFDIINEQVKDIELADKLTNHALKCLDLGCMFKRDKK